MNRKVKEIKETPGYFNTTAVPPGNVFPAPNGAETTSEENNLKSRIEYLENLLYRIYTHLRIHNKINKGSLAYEEIKTTLNIEENR